MNTEFTTRLENLIRYLQRLKLIIFPTYDLKIGYLTIFSTNNVDFELLKQQLSNLGEEKVVNNGNKYLLKVPVTILGEEISVIRIRKPDVHRQELGCCDLIYKGSDYIELRNVALEKGLDIILRKSYEMIELSTFDLNVYAYLVKDIENDNK